MDETCLRLLKDIHTTRHPFRHTEMRGHIENIYEKTGNTHLLHDIMQTEQSTEDNVAMEE